ncbi:MAG: urea ABC transporter ATP-binding subunit UrtE [Pseudomonadota bacterium]
MLQLENINQFYGDSHTLWDLTLDVPSGSRTCLLGRNGVGKTTTLKCVMGLQAISGGALNFDDQDIAGLPAAHRAALGIGYVPQGREIFPRLSVEENLKIGFAVCPADKAQEAYERVLDIFPVLRQMLGRAGGDLSGGQQQQLAIARALILEPKLLILDEPTEGIQPNIVNEIGELVVKLNEEQGITVLLVEQKLALVRRIADRFFVLDKGRVVANDRIENLNDDIINEHLTV